VADATQGPSEPRWRTTPALWEKLKPLAREKRRQPTQAEDVLWKALQGCGLGGLKFRRQHPVGPFIVDFYCSAARLVVEVDGPIHAYSPQEDALRQAAIEAHGFTVIRLQNEEVVQNLDAALSRISAAAATQSSAIPLAVDGEGVRSRPSSSRRSLPPRPSGQAPQAWRGSAWRSQGPSRRPRGTRAPVSGRRA
jgi:very-short-patch-repair endonuclease